MGMGFAPTWLRQVSPPASHDHFNQCLQVTEAINPAASPAAEHHRPLANTKLYCYCLVTGAHMCVNNLPRIALDIAAAGIRTCDP